MEERIKELIEEYKEAIEILRVLGETAIDERNESEMARLDLSARYLEAVIRDLEELLTL